MNQLYNFLTGTGLMISLVVFVGGLLFRLVWYFTNLDWRLDRVAYKAELGQGMKGGFYSIVKWLLPFGTRGWRAQPVMTICFFLFHVGAILVPLFALGHMVVLQTTFNFSFFSLSNLATDVLTITTIIGGVFLLVRRLTLKEVSILTTPQDYLILVLVLVPFISGFMTSMHGDSYTFWLTLHLISGHCFFLLAPFTKLSHIVLYFASRWQIGADYGIKRGGHSRGACFPW